MSGTPWQAHVSHTEDAPHEAITSRPIPQRADAPDAYAWPDAEVHNGVAGYQIHAYGDEPHGAFLKVWGPDQAAVEACLERLREFVDASGVFALFPREDDLG